MSVPTSRRAVLRQIERRLGDAPLVWFGTRGDDVEGVTDVANLAASVSIINRYQGSPAVRSSSLEQYSGLRVDLDTHDIDDDPFVDPIRELRRDLLELLATRSFVFTYRPSTFLSAACFVRSTPTTYLGMFKDHQSAFEHKPWVESAVAAMGIPHVPWTYVADSEQAAARAMLASTPIVVRRSRSSGGTGVVRVDTPDQLASNWIQQDEAFAAVAPFIDDAVPVNVGAVVWDSGVSVHLPSVQLIGVPELTRRSFGYCGNDFAGMKNVDPEIIDAIEAATRQIGGWMATLGYRGAFGVDFLIKDGVPLFTEVNARFQGSTNASSRVSRSMDESCLMTDHVAALLHLEPSPRRPLRDRVAEAPDLAHMVAHRLAPGPGRESGMALAKQLRDVAGYVHADVLHPSDLECESGATVARVTFGRSITSDGFSVDDDLRLALRQPAEYAREPELV